MRYLPILFLFFTPLAYGQAPVPAVLDVLHLKDGRTVQGTIVEYRYGRRAVLIDEEGTQIDVPAADIVRVNFATDKEGIRAAAESAPTTPAENAEIIPDRKWRHHVSAGGLFGLEANRFGGNQRSIGVQLSYGLLRSFGRLRAGGTVDYASLVYSRRENGLAVLGTAEYVIFTGGVNFYARLHAGPALPVGSTDDRMEITDRSVSLLYQPSVGMEFRSGGHDYHNLFLNFGYRFWNARFTVVNRTLDLFERNVRYRRFTLGGGYRF